MNLDSNHCDFSTSQTTLKERIVTNTSLLGGSRVLAALMGVATLIIAARSLDDQAAFGTLLFIHTYMLFFSEVASFQIWQAIIRFGADDLQQKNAYRLGKLIKTGVVIDALSALAAFLMSIGFFGLYIGVQSLLGMQAPDFLNAGPQNISFTTLLFAYCSIILFRQLNVSIGICRLFDKFGVLAARALIMPLVRLVGVIIAYFMDWGLVGFLAVWFTASFLSYLVLQIAAFIEVSRRQFLPFIRQSKVSRGMDIPGLYPFVFKSCIDSTLSSFKSYLPSAFIMFILGPAALAVFRIGEELSRIFYRGVSLFDQVLFPELTRLVAEKNIVDLLKLTRKAALGIGLIGLTFSAIIIAFGEPLITMGFSKGYEDASPIAVMLLICTSLIGIAMPFHSLFYALKLPGQAIGVQIICIAAYALLFFILVERWGIFAAGWASIGTAVVEVALVMFLTLRIIKKGNE